MSTIAELMVKINGDTTGLQNALTKAQSGSKALLKGVGLLGVGLAAVGAKSVISAGKLEATTVAFTTMLGSAEEATSLLKDLQEFAATTPFELTEIQAASKSLLAFGVNAGDIEGTLRSLGDVSAGIGAPIGEIAELYGKAKTQGRLFAEDINQLTGRGIPIIKELAAQFGISESEVKKLVESGDVGFEQLQTAFKDMTAEGSQFGGMMEAQSATLPGLWSNLMDALGQSSVVLGQEIIEALDLKEKLKGAVETLGKLTTLLQEKGLKGAIEEIFPESTRVAIVMISGAILAALIPSIVTLIATFGLAVIAMAPFLIAGAAVAGLAYLIYSNWKTIKDFFSGLWASISESFKNGVNSIKTFVTKTIPGVATDIVNYFKAIPSKMLEIGGNIVKGLIDGITSMPAWIEQQIQKFCDGIASTVKSFFGIASPSKLMMQYGVFVAEGFANGIDKAKTKAQKAAENMASAVTSAVQNAMTYASLGLEIFEQKMLLASNGTLDIISKQQLLEAQLQASKDQIEVLSTAYGQMSAATGEASTQSQQLLLQLLKEQNAQADLQKQIDKTTDSLQSQIKLRTFESGGVSSLIAYNSQTGESVIKRKGVTSIVDKLGNVTSAISATAAEISNMAAKYPNVDASVAKAMVISNKQGISSYAVGTPYVPQTGLAMIHKGERIIPANQNKNSGINITITGNTISNQMDINAIGEQLVTYLRRKGVVASA